MRSGRFTEAAHEVRGLGTVVHLERLVRGAQVLLYRGLREVEALAYLGVAQAFDDEPKDLSLAGGEGVNVRVLFLGQQVLHQLPRGDNLALRGHLDGPDDVLGPHAGVDVAARPRPQRCPGERQVQPRAEDQDRRLRILLLEALYPLGGAFSVLRTQYHRGRLARWASPPDPHSRALPQGPLEADGHHRVGITRKPDGPERFREGSRWVGHRASPLCKLLPMWQETLVLEFIILRCSAPQACGREVLTLLRPGTRQSANTLAYAADRIYESRFCERPVTG